MSQISRTATVSSNVDVRWFNFILAVMITATAISGFIGLNLFQQFQHL